MEKEFIPYEQSLALKELGFDEKCLSCYLYEVETFSWELNYQISNNSIPWIISAPLYQQAFRWFRKKYFKMSYVYYDVEYKFCFCIGYNDKTKGFNTYEEAELACLKELIELVKNK